MKLEIMNDVNRLVEKERSMLYEADFNFDPRRADMSVPVVDIYNEKVALFEGFVGEISDPETKKQMGIAIDFLIHKMTRKAQNLNEIRQLFEDSSEGKVSMVDYERTLEDLSQIDALLEQDIRKSISRLAKAKKSNEKQNRSGGKSFLNFIACKFKKSKLQSANENAELTETEQKEQ